MRTRSSLQTLVALVLIAVVAAPFAQARTTRPDSVNTPPPPPPPRRQPQGPVDPGPPVFGKDFRSPDGSENNPQHSDWGAVGRIYIRNTAVDYADGVEEPAGGDRASARSVSNAMAAQDGDILNARRVSDIFWQWGQFVDHDIDLTPTADPAEAFDIIVPTGDPWFDPSATGGVTIPVDRSGYEVVDGVRQQLNSITSYLDGSNVYGCDQDRADALRTLDGTGRLKTSDGDLLPYNEVGEDNAGGTFAGFFLAGDVRANEQTGLIAFHTLFVREHNWWADRIAAQNPDYDGEQIYQEAKAMVVAEIQAITYREYLPLLLGRRGLPRYRGYRPDVDASVNNVFATAAYRFGHSMVSGTFLRLDADGNVAPEGNLALRDSFFNLAEIEDNGIDSVLRGLAAQQAQELDTYIVDDLRNFLFGDPGSGGFDLASLNVQRGRDHGLASYNQTRIDVGLRPARNWEDISSDPTIQANLASVYTSVDDVDVWIGCLAEDKVRGAMVGELALRIMGDQFSRIRDGDRFWYEFYLPKRLVREVNRTKLSTIIKRNTGIGRELSPNAFRAPR